MFRLVFVAFAGETRTDAAEHAHESPPVMSWILVLLAVPTTLAGFWGIDTYLAHQLAPEHAAESLGWFQQILAPIKHAPVAAFTGLAAVALGFFAAFGMYGRAVKDPLPEKFGGLARAMRNRFYFDELYEKLIAATHEALSYLADFVDRWLIAGLCVRGIHGTTEIVGRALRLMQTGNLQTYAFWAVLGLAMVIYFVLK